ncbi:MAG: hypothetical protein H0V51_02565, partial [Chloroflexi bacterium]|nr:hypothetical protein [Chloroflexota bacterium]
MIVDQQATESVIDPRIVLRVLRRRFWIIALLGLIVPAAAYGYASLAEKKYRASAT